MEKNKKLLPTTHLTFNIQVSPPKTGHGHPKS